MKRIGTYFLFTVSGGAGGDRREGHVLFAFRRRPGYLQPLSSPSSSTTKRFVVVVDVVVDVVNFAATLVGERSRRSGGQYGVVGGSICFITPTELTCCGIVFGNRSPLSHDLHPEDEAVIEEKKIKHPLGGCRRKNKMKKNIQDEKARLIERTSSTRTSEKENSPCGDGPPLLWHVPIPVRIAFSTNACGMSAA